MSIWNGVIRVFDSSEEVRRTLGTSHYIAGSPVVTELADKIASSIGAGGVALTNCGLGAIQATIDELLGPEPDKKRVICSKSVYPGTMELMQALGAKGVGVDIFDPTKPELLVSILGLNQVALCFVETIGNAYGTPVSNIPKIIETLSPYGVALVIDNTTTPNLGELHRFTNEWIEVVFVSSLSKWQVSDSGVAGGMICSRDGFIQRVKSSVTYRQNCMQPVVAEGIWWERTELYYEVFCANSLEMAKILNSCDKVDSVSYPGLPGHPQYSLLNEHYSGLGGGLVYVVVHCRDIADKLVDGLNKSSLYEIAPSFGARLSRVWPLFSPDQNPEDSVVIRFSSGMHRGKNARDTFEHLSEVLASL